MTVDRAAAQSTLHIRPYADADEQEVIALLRAALGEGPSGHRSAPFFRWKHLANPFGPSFMLVAEEEGRIVGLRAFLRWRLRSGDRVLRAVRAVDTATHPEAQGRGIFCRLTRAAIEALRADTDLIYNTPNEKSLPGYLKMGWRVVGRVPVHVRVRRPVHVVRGLLGSGRSGSAPEIDAATADDALADEGRVAEVLEALPRGDARLSTPLSVPYLRWRYARDSELGYRAVWRRGGLAIFRARPRLGGHGISVAELLVPRGHRATARALLSSVARSARVDHIVCSFPARSPGRRAATASLFVRAPRGMTLVANPLSEELGLDPMRLDAWALSLGDLEVF